MQLRVSELRRDPEAMRLVEARIDELSQLYGVLAEAARDEQPSPANTPST